MNEENTDIILLATDMVRSVSGNDNLGLLRALTDQR